MAFTPVEIIALILIVFTAIKILILLVNPMTWMKYTENFFKKPNTARIIALILAAIILYYLTQSGVSIVTIIAVAAFVFTLIMIGLAPHLDSIMVKYKSQIKRGNIWKDNWLYTLIWIVLMIWALKEILM